MDYEAKFAEGKTRETSQTFLNLRHSSKHVDLVISSPGRRQENRIFRFLKFLKKRFLSKSKIFRRSSLREI